MEKINPIEDVALELQDIMKDVDAYSDTQVLLMMAIKRLDSIDKTLSDLTYKKEKSIAWKR